MNSRDDGADYEVDPPGRPEPAASSTNSGEPGPAGWPHNDDDLLADLPPMPPKPEGPKPAADDPGQQRTAADSPASEPPDLESLYRMAQGIMPEHDQMIEHAAAMHARWRKAWRETGEFTDAESFELSRIIVAAMTGGIQSLD